MSAGVAMVASYLFGVSGYLFFPADFLLWSETDYVNDILKFRSGYPIFTADPNTGSETNLECYAQLTAANQRGFCDSRACSCIEDACELLNPDPVLRCPATL